MISASKYVAKPWREKFKGDVSFDKLYIEESWHEIFSNIRKKGGFKKIEQVLTDEKENNIFPYPDLMFSAFNLTPLNTVKVVIVGQDPYPGAENYKGKMIPHAMGLSFSVPMDIEIPPSLDNIFNNLLKFGHITRKPTHGNLFTWASQGCLMLNTALTIRMNEKAVHMPYWNWITNEIIKAISDKLDNIVFVLWGGPALSKLSLINVDKHNVIISSHPSPLSCSKPVKEYPPFMDYDHFGEINKFIKKAGRQQIVWQYM